MIAHQNYFSGRITFRICNSPYFGFYSLYLRPNLICQIISMLIEFNHAAFLAHLSRRLTGDLIRYPWSGVHPSSSVGVVRPSTILNIFFYKTACPIRAKFYVEPPWVGGGGAKVCSRHLGHMTKMAATPIYGKNPSKIFSRTGGRFSRNLVCSIGDSSPS